MKRRVVTLIIIALLAVGAVGCASTSKEEKSSKQTSSELNKAKVMNNLKITLKNVETAEKGKEKQVELTVAISNTDSIEQPIGANDFILKTADGKTKAIDGSANNFGEVIPKGKQSEGKMYFTVPQAETNGTVIYQPEKKTLAEWNVSF